MIATIYVARTLNAILVYRNLFTFSDTVGKVDIIATVSGDGSSSLANALRLAIARCLASMLPIDQGKNRLLVTGLLSQDNRFAERKQPGQRKARKKPIW